VGFVSYSDDVIDRGDSDRHNGGDAMSLPEPRAPRQVQPPSARKPKRTRRLVQLLSRDTTEELAELRKLVAEQQRQIDTLQRRVGDLTEENGRLKRFLGRISAERDTFAAEIRRRDRVRLQKQAAAAAHGARRKPGKARPRKGA
jgi:septal ring factor EnvC (AmiA/AmiB activator)